ncbi:hypothetical protein DSO57_1031722 [Entomophthora muscae]|uniref:Uncharacterized protein n=1 Tax=Entomophthora muscae TaxID=34485 RepID=A0ACC2TMG6_9FUNG|nr:hypothetical protein DSO57_1031722 [Entomophthora muscae]
MASKLKLLSEKSWSSFKSKLKSFVLPTPEENGFDVDFSPPTIVRLEESVFSDYADSESSFDSSHESLPIYSYQTSQVPSEKPALKSCIRRSVSTPTMDLSPTESEPSPSLSIHSTATSARWLRRRPQISFENASVISESPSTSKVFRFSETVVVYETYNSDHYPREAVDNPDLTLKQIEKLNKEIRRFKLSEMRVHPDSVNNMSLNI